MKPYDEVEITDEYRDLLDAIEDEGLRLRTWEAYVKQAAEAARSTRAGLRLSRRGFHAFTGIEPSLMRAWERGRMVPPSYALVLLRLIAQSPDLIARVRGVGVPGR